MKRDRHAEIIRLIHEYDIGTQEELARRLNEEGYAVTQATVSRDIRALQLSKVTDEKGRVKYVLLKKTAPGSAEKLVRVLRDTFVSMDTADNLLVIKTVSGMAMAAAASIDAMHWPEIIGCIAGDDTIFCALRSKEEAARAKRRLQDLLDVV